MNNCIWLDIKNYEGLYQANNIGQIRRIKPKEKTLKQVERKDGYLFVNLSKNGKSIPTKVHKIIAETFLKNDKNYYCINHIDGNKKNNNVDNLEYCSQSHNIKEAYRLGLRKPNQTNKGKRKRVLQYSLNGDLIKIWGSIKEASIILQIKDSNISQACKNKRNQAGGFIWKYETI